VHVGEIRDRRRRDRPAHRGGGLVDLRAPADLLRPEAARHRRAERETPGRSRAGGAGARRVADGEHEPVRAQPALGAARHHHHDVALDIGRCTRRGAREQRLQGRRREAAREIVDAAVALGLAEDRDDLARGDRAGMERGFEAGDVVGGCGGDAVDIGDAHGVLPADGARREVQDPGRYRL
jgi:hypothetical protein